MPTSSLVLLSFHGRDECQAPPEPQPRHPGMSLDAMVCLHVGYGFLPSSSLPPGKGFRVSPVSLPWRIPILGWQPICGAHFLPALWDTMHSKQLGVLYPKNNSLKNADMVQVIITLGWALCPRARSCSACHHGTLMAARVTLTLQLGTQKCPLGCCYHGIIWPTFPMLGSPGLDIQT